MKGLPHVSDVPFATLCIQTSGDCERCRDGECFNRLLCHWGAGRNTHVVFLLRCTAIRENEGAENTYAVAICDPVYSQDMANRIAAHKAKELRRAELKRWFRKPKHGLL